MICVTLTANALWLIGLLYKKAYVSLSRSLYLGNILMRQGEFEDAESALNTALTCNQACLEEVHYSLGLVCRCMGRLTDAKSHFEKAVKFDDQFADAKTALKDVKTALSK